MKKSTKRILIISLIVICLAFIVSKAASGGDFKVFLGAAKLLIRHENFYGKWIFMSEGVYGLYYYSPLFALLLVPFSYLPNFVPNFIWLLLNVYFLYRIWQLIARYFNLSGLSHQKKIILLVIPLLFTLRFINDNFRMIQMTIYLLWSALESLDAFDCKKHVKGGIILALAINIKILPVVLLPYLLYRRKFVPLLFTLGFLAFFLILPSLFIGFHYNILLLTEWWKTINPLNSEHLAETDLDVQCLSALIPTLLTKTTGQLDFRRNIMNIDINYAIMILNFIRAFFIVFTLYFLRTFPFKTAKSKMQEFWEISYILLIIPLIFPHQQKYEFVLILPAMVYIAYFFVYFHTFANTEFKKRKKWKVILIILAIVFILTTITSDAIIGKSLNRITQHYRTITYGVVLLVFILAKCNPKYIDKCPG